MGGGEYTACTFNAHEGQSGAASEHGISTCARGQNLIYGPHTIGCPLATLGCVHQQ
jgi:hypothetical protein